MKDGVYRREDFIRNRNKEYDDAQAFWKDSPQSACVIIVQPPEEIICDTCNKEIEGAEIFVHHGWCLCDDCRE